MKEVSRDKNTVLTSSPSTPFPFNSLTKCLTDIKIIKINDRTFELGNFGRQHLDRKLEEGKGNRFEESLLPEALRDAKPYQASDNSASYRSDNAAWIGSIDGKPTVVYTRVNKNNAEEIIGWH